MRRQTLASQRAAANASINVNDPARRQDGDHTMQDVSTEGGTDGIKSEDSSGPSQVSPQGGVRTAEAQRVAVAVDPQAAEKQLPIHLKIAWEYIEEVVQILKTAFPLLILSLETMVDQISQRFKATPEEEIYRLVCMLLQDAVQVGFLLSLAPSF